jgi:hypothetical protein
MKLLWCWRCKLEVPMLDDEEFRRAVLDRTPISEFLADPTSDMGILKNQWADRMIEVYEQVTGVREQNWEKVFHHRLADYGPPCSNCGKPLRTPRARYCAACGFRPVMAGESR